MNPIDKIISLAIKEDGCLEDITSRAIIPADLFADAAITARQELVLSGALPAARVYDMLDPAVTIEFNMNDGSLAQKGDVIANVSGPTLSILAGERLVLNFLQQLSGVATLTREFCKAIEGSSAKILDTRKTVPGMRLLQKQAVVHGGGANHRMSLSDAILIKDNHIISAGSITRAVELAREKTDGTLEVEVEVENLEGVREALEAGADIILLDNMTTELMSEAVKLINGKAKAEASGSISPSNVRQVAMTGVDRISIGKLTHSAPACDISMDFS
ncbi:MAG: carboxylating nicotinate-nucleotide diphosphorylase [Candidatus Coatesbacteria bacterium]|nr:carboxylating nicotinate-nucleotide diphosphorylase [Candidatus Coatesbacteria bacterium]